jgi:hypothetical protein
MQIDTELPDMIILFYSEVNNTVHQWTGFVADDLCVSFIFKCDRSVTNSITTDSLKHFPTKHKIIWCRLKKVLIHSSYAYPGLKDPHLCVLFFQWSSSSPIFCNCNSAMGHVLKPSVLWHGPSPASRNQWKTNQVGSLNPLGDWLKKRKKGQLLPKLESQLIYKPSWIICIDISFPFSLMKNNTDFVSF